jgi:hypothetical protein
MPFNLYLLFAVALAAIVPLALIATRGELRRVRRLVIEELRCLIFKGENLPQIAMVEARYVDAGDRPKDDPDRRYRGGGREAQLRIWTGATVFFLVCLGGYLLLLTPTVWLISPEPRFPRLTFALLWATEREVTADLAQAITVAGMAFLGGYVFQLRYLVRTTLNQELSALAFVRASVRILQGVIIAVVAFRVLGASLGVDCYGETGCAGLSVSQPGAAPLPDNSARFALALGVAFVIGYWPDLGLMRLAKGLRIRIKTVDEKALEDARIVPLEVIDGIDAETAFRLEESNLHDVQNLATANPIQLYVETPFGLLQIFDWVLQAQLCENAGPRTFGELKRLGIRTIFDLERAALACNAPGDYVAALGGILFHNADEGFRQRFGLPATPTLTAEHVRHAVAIILDDLHVHQLRALWRVMMAKTMTGDQRWLYPTGPLPGEPDLPPCPPPQR